MRTSGATPLSRIAPQQEGTFGSIANARFQLLNKISSHAVTFRLPSLWKPLTDIAAGAVLQSNKRSKEAHDVRVREKGRSCTPIYPEAGHRLMAIFSREYPHAVSSRPNALSKTGEVGGIGDDSGVLFSRSRAVIWKDRYDPFGNMAFACLCGAPSLIEILANAQNAPPLGACCRGRFSAHRRSLEAKEVR